MGFLDKLKQAGAGALKAMTSAGYVSSHDFPVGTTINFGSDEGESAMIFTLPSKEEIKITHDMVDSASVLAMGVIDIEHKDNVTTSFYGTKYLIKLKDGRQAVLTVGLGNTLYRIENIIF